MLTLLGLCEVQRRGQNHTCRSSRLCNRDWKQFKWAIWCAVQSSSHALIVHIHFHSIPCHGLWGRKAGLGVLFIWVVCAKLASIYRDEIYNRMKGAMWWGMCSLLVGMVDKNTICSICNQKLKWRWFTISDIYTASTCTLLDAYISRYSDRQTGATDYLTSCCTCTHGVTTPATFVIHHLDRCHWYK